jgi:DNA-binding NarL/FixJ family response regulator
MEMIGEADNGSDGLQLIKKVKPAVALVDILLPQLNGIDLIAHAKRECPQVYTLILSGYEDRDHVLDALRAGASGYVTKNSTASELEGAIRALSKGQSYLSPGISQHLITDLLRHQIDNDNRESLTLRQREILRLIAEGQTTKEIANVLALSVKTVETHRTQLMERSGTKNVAQLVRYGIKNGFVQD